MKFTKTYVGETSCCQFLLSESATYMYVHAQDHFASYANKLLSQYSTTAGGQHACALVNTNSICHFNNQMKSICALLPFTHTIPFVQGVIQPLHLFTDGVNAVASHKDKSMQCIHTRTCCTYVSKCTHSENQCMQQLCTPVPLV